MTELQSGVVLGRYELLVRIGRGGMASVWVARERSAVSGKQRLVAVKAMLPELAAHSEFRSMFLGEVQIIQSISHENVVKLFEVSEDRGILYMAMEWVEGDSLRNVVKAAKSRGALPAEIAVRIAADAAAGLQAAHELRDWDGELRGIVHCDVSPHNILIGIDGKAKLVDFGIANALGRLEPTGNADQIKGKLSYMSPEQARGERVDRRTDVFALGIVMFEMTTGEQLFKGRDANHTLELVRHGTIPRPSHLNPRYPERLEAIVMQSLDRDPDRRYQTAHELEQALTGFLFEERILVSHSAVTQLLMRIMGPRIEKRREVITRIIQALDGQFAPAAMGPNQLAALADLSPMHSDPFNITLTNAADPNALGIAARLESHTIVSRPPSTRDAEVPVLIQPDSPTSSWVWLSVVAVALAIGAVGTYFYIQRSQPSTVELLALQQATASTTATTPSSASRAAESEKNNDRVQSVESLPVARDMPPVSVPGSSKKAPKDRSSNKGEASATPAELTKAAPRGNAGESETPVEAKPAAGTDTPTDDDAKPAAPEGINKVAANASLANVAAAARECRSQGDTPTGPGRAAVTFASDGTVIAVSLSQKFTGTAVGSCVASQFRQAHAPAFSGDSVTLFYPFDIAQ